MREEVSSEVEAREEECVGKGGSEDWCGDRRRKGGALWHEFANS